MSDDSTQGVNEPSPASAGSHGDGMVARLRSWRDERGYPTPGEMLDEAADEIERLRLTDEEREAVECGIQAIGLAPYDERTLAYADRLRCLLERTSAR